jgi:hypothetical protein
MNGFTKVTAAAETAHSELVAGIMASLLRFFATCDSQISLNRESWTQVIKYPLGAMAQK